MKTPLIQFDFQDVVFPNPLCEKILIKQLKQQHRLSAPADAGDYLDLAVVFLELNEKEGVMILLTSHYSEDIRELCKNTYDMALLRAGILDLFSRLHDMGRIVGKIILLL